jgi:N-formylglutamate amidohydrolase
MCEACKRRRNFLLNEEEGKKESIKKIPAVSTGILSHDVRREQDFRRKVRERWYDNLVLNIPHSSIDGIGQAKWNNKVALLSEVKRWTDWYTDLLFVPDKRDGIKTIIGDYSRFFVDVERLPNDPLEEIGQGILYEKFNGLKRLIGVEERRGLMAYYLGYSKNLKEMLNEHSLLIDCHSFPSDLSDVDICIGYNNDWSRPTDFVIELCKSVFEKQGYQVGINTPYANAIAPETGYAYNSIMIEVNKRLYLNEQTLEMTEGVIKFRKCTAELYSLLKNYWEEI